MISISLPYPPSVNKYWRNNRGRTHISHQGRKYREQVNAEVLSQLGGHLQTIRGRVKIELCACCPDNRKRDLDNVLKAALDAITHAEVWGDDGQVDALLIWRGPVMPPDGSLAATIEELSHE